MKLVVLFCLAVLTPILRAEPTPTPASAEATPDVPGVNLQRGPLLAKLGNVAEINIPEGFVFIGPDSLDRFFELTRNFRGGTELGVVIAPDNWMLVFDYDEIGYVKDDEKNALDADALLKARQESLQASNEERRRRQWPELQYQGWAAKPYYDPQTNNLKWALKISSGEDNHKSIGINESIRLLGRAGVMNVTLACDAEGFETIEAKADSLLRGFTYVEGQRYAEFKEGDKIAEYGLAALVLGGAGAVAAKTGLLSKFWKLIVVTLAAVGGLIAKGWRKLLGKDQT